ncbi:hypothetical protein L873DRAFT_68325 [Choiromyces venosus 120613-1]|uniref:Uncharacterized protein n=1 Tax=Choiromyces venosus 120613-1 TaxID=1336337 RepID=A0A3N4J8E2_9PEZI|nr:hypothetical protein L873DRAFT_68325 [Choiromyces venosus 120613-1]
MNFTAIIAKKFKNLFICLKYVISFLEIFCFNYYRVVRGFLCCSPKMPAKTGLFVCKRYIATDLTNFKCPPSGMVAIKKFSKMI